MIIETVLVIICVALVSWVVGLKTEVDEIQESFRNSQGKWSDLLSACEDERDSLKAEVSKQNRELISANYRLCKYSGISRQLREVVENIPE